MRWTIASTGILAMGAVAVATTIWINRHLHPPRNAPVVYLLHLDDNSRIRFAWHSINLQTSVAVHSGETVKIPAGAHVLAIGVDGRAETWEGPKTIRQFVAPRNEVDPLASPLRDVVAAFQTSTAQNPLPIVITSPLGVTRFLNPPIDWLAAPGQLYDVAIRDPAEPDAPVRIALGVRPPVALEKLETTEPRKLRLDRVFEVVVRKASDSNSGSAARFLTSPEAQVGQLPTEPSALLAEAAAALARRPYRLGDASEALSRLPPDWAQTELAVRLRMLTAAEIGLRSDLARARAAADVLAAP